MDTPLVERVDGWHGLRFVGKDSLARESATPATIGLRAALAQLRGGNPTSCVSADPIPNLLLSPGDVFAYRMPIVTRLSFRFAAEAGAARRRANLPTLCPPIFLAPQGEGVVSHGVRPVGQLGGAQLAGCQPAEPGVPAGPVVPRRRQTPALAVIASATALPSLAPSCFSEYAFRRRRRERYGPTARGVWKFAGQQRTRRLFMALPAPVISPSKAPAQLSFLGRNSAPTTHEFSPEPYFTPLDI